MSIINDIATTEQLSEVEVVETKLRNNPALSVTFPQIPGRVAFLADDPGDSHWSRRLVCGFSQADLDNYTDDGQDGYGSDDILADEDGSIFVFNIKGKKASLEDDRPSDFTLDDDDAESYDTVSEAVREFGRDPQSVAWDGTRFLDALNHILRAVRGTEVGEAFLREHTPSLELR